MGAVSWLGGHVRVHDRATMYLELQGADRPLIGQDGIIVDRPAHLPRRPLGEDAYYRYVLIDGTIHRLSAYSLEDA